MSRLPVKNSEVREMHRLAEAGLHQAAIARRLGRNRETIKRFLGDKGAFYQASRLTADDLREWYAKPSMLAREELAERHGYASANSMGVVVSRTRKRLAAEGVEIETGQERRQKRANEKAVKLAIAYQSRPKGWRFEDVAVRCGYGCVSHGWRAFGIGLKLLRGEARA